MLVSDDDRLKNDNFERIQFVQQIIDGLKLNENLVFMGHSRGTENALIAAAENGQKSRGLILLNAIGISTHRGIRPRWRIALLAAIWKPLWLRFFSNWLLFQSKFHCFRSHFTGSVFSLRNAQNESPKWS